MLVANPGQNAAYVLHAKKSSSSCHSANNSNSTNSSSNASTVIGSSSKIAANSLSLKTARHVLANNCLGTATISAKTLPLKLAPPSLDNNTTNKHHTSTTINSNNHNTSATTNISSSSTTTSTSNALMKTLSVRLNRGTEFLKETVHKALISKIPSHLSSVLNLNLYTVPPTVTHRFPAERVNASSADSLQTEMCHFKPIRAAPTTPWKSNSKSRGASLKMPKACLATKVKVDCYDAAGDGTSLEAEGYLQFRPKPNSTLLTTIFTTPSRQSAFVCLVTKMKLNTSMKNKHTNSAKHKLSKIKQSRSRSKPKDNVDFFKSSSEIAAKGTLNKRNLRKRRNPFVTVKEMNLPTELIITRSSIRNRTNSSTAAVEASKSKSKSKSKLAESHNSDAHKANQRLTRKRKLSNDNCNTGTDEYATRPSLRKSARLSKDSRMGASIASHSYARLARRPSPIVQQKRAWSLFSPPLTRSRLKQLSEQKFNRDPLL